MQRAAGDKRTPADATVGFLGAMRAAGNPGVVRFDLAVKTGPFKRTPKVEGWVVRPVDREDFGDAPKRYEPGLFLTVDADGQVLNNERRGGGQRASPKSPHPVRPEPIETPEDR